MTGPRARGAVAASRPASGNCWDRRKEVATSMAVIAMTPSLPN